MRAEIDRVSESMDSQRWNQTFRLKPFTFCILNEDLNLKAIHKAQRKRMGVTQEQLALTVLTLAQSNVDNGMLLSPFCVGCALPWNVMFL